MSNDDVFNGNGVQITLKDETTFLVIVETLTRIGISSKKDQTLYQSCHILHKKGKYAILHFKELFLMDGKESNIEDSDFGRRNSIAKLLEQWNLLTINPEQLNEDSVYTPINQIKILSHKEKSEFNLVPKYTIGNPVKKKTA
jgi:hypothetical protein